MAFEGMRVLALESRRSMEMATLIRKQGGEPFVAPSMREVPTERNEPAFAFAERLFAGTFDGMILLTGVGTRYLDQVLATRFGADQFREALKTITLLARGPKPMAVLREWSISGAVLIPEPNTWREILTVMQTRPERRIAIQEYGRGSPELVKGLTAMGCAVEPVPVYRWELPEDTGPLREAVLRLANGEFDIAIFTTSIQLPHLLQIAAEEGLESEVRAQLRHLFVASIGPTTSEALQELGFPANFEPSHPKMGILVSECSAAYRAKAESHG
jgi:uroporphyrinogen-III synthase